MKFNIHATQWATFNLHLQNTQHAQTPNFQTPHRVQGKIKLKNKPSPSNTKKTELFQWDMPEKADNMNHKVHPQMRKSSALPAVSP